MPMWCVAPLEMNEGNSLGARVQSAYRLHCRKGPKSDLFYSRRKWRTCITCYKFKATNTNSENVMFTVCPLQQWLYASASLLRHTYTEWLAYTRMASTPNSDAISLHKHHHTNIGAQPHNFVQTFCTYGNIPLQGLWETTRKHQG